MRRTIDSPEFRSDISSTDLRVVLGSPNAIWRDLTAPAGVPNGARLRRGDRASRRFAKRGEREVAHARVVGLDEEGKPELLTFADNSGRFDVAAPTTVDRHVVRGARRNAEQRAHSIFTAGTDVRIEARRVAGWRAPRAHPRTAIRNCRSPRGCSFTESKARSTRASVPIGVRRVRDQSSIRCAATSSTPLPAGRYRVCATKGIEYSIDCRELAIEGGRGMTYLALELRHVIPTPTELDCDLARARAAELRHAGVERRSRAVLGRRGDRFCGAHRAQSSSAIMRRPSSATGPFGRARHGGRRRGHDLQSALRAFRRISVSGATSRFRRFVIPTSMRSSMPRIAAIRIASCRSIIRAWKRGSDIFRSSVTTLKIRKIPSKIRLDFDSIEVYNGYEIQQPDQSGSGAARLFFIAQSRKKIRRDRQQRLAPYSISMGRLSAHASWISASIAAPRSRPARSIRWRWWRPSRVGMRIVTSGPVLEVVANGAKPGDEIVRGSRSRSSAHVRLLRAAPWIDVTSLELIVDGQSARTIEIKSQPTKTGRRARHTRRGVQARTVRFAGDVAVPHDPDKKSWFLFIARGTRKLDDVLPFMPVPPFAMTNPIWITPSGTTNDKPQP